MLKSILFTHDDLDGAGCRIVYEFFNKKNKHRKIIDCSNNSIDDDVINIIDGNSTNNKTEIIFADICPSRGIIDKLIEKYNIIRVFDHHVTNIYVTNILPTAVVSPSNELGKMNSGTSLLYQYFLESNVVNNKLLDLLVDTIRSYDTFEWKSTNNIDAKRMLTLFSILGMDRFCEYYLNRLNSKDHNLFLKTDLLFIEGYIENRQKLMEKIKFDDIYKVNIKGLNAAVMFSGMGVGVSDFSHQFLTNHPEFDIFIMINLGYKKLEFRTIRDDIDVAFYLAKGAGGGGHPKAAGSPIPEQLINEILNMVKFHIENPDGFLKEVNS